MYQCHQASTSDSFDPACSTPNPNLSLSAEAPVDARTYINDAITTGRNGALTLLLLNGIVSLLWGIALAIFASGVVPVTWAISQWGKTHMGVTNVLVTLVGTASTTHLKYISTGILQQYSQYLLADGFTVSQLAWMQGIKEWSVLTAFESRRKRVAWLVVYAGMAVHSASVVSILQPNTFYKHFPFDDPIPCGTNPNSLSLAVPNNIPPQVQSQIDQLSFEIGLQLGNYIEQVGGNTTTSVAGRVYVKDNYGYGAIGGLSDGLQEIPGVSFTAQCTNGKNANTSSFSSLWGSVFPGRAPPTISRGPNGFQSFSDLPIPSQMQSIVSDLSFNLTGSEVAMYALVNPSGSGALVTVNSTGNPLCCAWQAAPKLVFVQTVNFAAKSLGAQDSKTIPQLTGRAVLLTLRGMAAAVHLGATLVNSISVESPLFVIPQTSSMLQTLLADGAKASMTLFNDYFGSLLGNHQSTPGVSMCDSNNRTVASHWRFGNSHNLGWVAIIWTTGLGILAIFSAVWFTPRPRVQGIQPLEIPYAFVLGRIATVDGIKKGNPVLSVKPTCTFCGFLFGHGPVLNSDESRTRIYRYHSIVTHDPVNTSPSVVDP